MTWAQFCRASEPFAIALDGYVAEGPRFDPTGPRANFNHHEGVDRLATRSTSGQILLAIRQGLFETFRDDHGPRAVAYVNDCDEDVCMSWYLLSHGYLAAPTMNPLLNRIVGVVDMLDTTAGAYPLPIGLPLLEELAWIFEPYRRFRASGELDRRDADAFRSVITDVTNRIGEYVAGHGRSIPLDTRYEIIGGGAGWVLVREHGSQARTALFADGHRAFVAVRERPDGRFAYSAGRMSPFVPFPIPEILAALTAAEGDSEVRWGGGNTIGGSDRSRGSRLSPSDVQRIVEDVLRRSA